MTHILLLLPFLFLFLSLLQFLQVFLSQLNDVGSLFLRGHQSVGEGAGPSVERLTGGGAGQILPQVLIHRFALQQLSPEENIQGQGPENST